MAAILSTDTRWQPLTMKRPLVAAFRGAEMLAEEGACLGSRGSRKWLRRRFQGVGYRALCPSGFEPNADRWQGPNKEQAEEKRGRGSML